MLLKSFLILSLAQIGSSADILKGESGDLNFLVMGDWGGLPDAPYTTAAEQATAASMNALGGKVGARFTLALGDNFYYDGVLSLDDQRFNSTFENIFTGSNLQGENFFRVLSGNHDHNGNVSAQVRGGGRSEGRKAGAGPKDS